MITVGGFQSDWRKYNPTKKLKGQRGRYRAPLRATGFSRGFGFRPTPKIPAAREKNLLYPGYRSVSCKLHLPIHVYQYSIKQKWHNYTTITIFVHTLLKMAGTQILSFLLTSFD